MCNTIFHDSKGYLSVPIEGFGWKIFQNNSPNHPFSLVDGDTYKINEDGWIEWDDSGSHGFCFFLDKEEAERAMKCWSNAISPYWVCLKKIEYKECLGSKIEPTFMEDLEFRTAIAKQFRIAENQD